MRCCRRSPFSLCARGDGESVVNEARQGYVLVRDGLGTDLIVVQPGLVSCCRYAHVITEFGTEFRGGRYNAYRNSLPGR